MRNILSFLLLLSLNANYAQDVTDEIKSNIHSLQKTIQWNDSVSLSEMIQYPLHREIPIPEVKNAEQFIQRYSEIFDENLKQLILKSDVKKDWSKVGWRGIMFRNGDLWLNEDGFIIAINYQSREEQQKAKVIIDKDKNALYPELREYQEHVLILETNKFKIRIDKLESGQYRYASWQAGACMSAKPMLVLTNGTLEFDGSGGNKCYIFKNGSYSYMCSINVIGLEGNPSAELKVMKGNDKLTQQNGKLKELIDEKHLAKLLN